MGEAFLGCWFQSLQDNTHFGFEVAHRGLSLML